MVDNVVPVLENLDIQDKKKAWILSNFLSNPKNNTHTQTIRNKSDSCLGTWLRPGVRRKCVFPFRWLRRLWNGDSWASSCRRHHNCYLLANYRHLFNQLQLAHLWIRTQQPNDDEHLPHWCVLWVKFGEAPELAPNPCFSSLPLILDSCVFGVKMCCFF